MSAFHIIIAKGITQQRDVIAEFDLILCSLNQMIGK